jgi:hypothetical protein
MTTKGSPKSPSGVCVIKLRLEKELSITENSFKIKKEEAVSRVRNFWRNLIEGDTHGGKMVQAARKRAAC